MHYLPFWVGGLVLAAVPLVHWFLLKRMFAVSGRLSSITDWLRGVRPAPEPQLSDADLLAALRAETGLAFGAEALDECGAPPVASGCEAPELVATTGDAVATTTPPTATLLHLVFLVCVALGATLSVWQTTGAWPKLGGPDASFRHFFGDSILGQTGVLLGGGFLVGFGTRMAGGCTSGHGLCGVSRLQPGSLLATACFFGCGIAVSFLLELLVRT